MSRGCAFSGWIPEDLCLRQHRDQPDSIEIFCFNTKSGRSKLSMTFCVLGQYVLYSSDARSPKFEHYSIVESALIHNFCREKCRI